MKQVKIDNKFNEILNRDPISQVEKVFNKHYSEFTQDENMMMLANAFHTNEIKSNYLKSLGDTHFSITWNEFINLIESYGFIKGLRYDFKHGEDTDEAALYYHPDKGLIIWATSYWNKKSLNSGTMYGQVKSKEKVEYETKINSYSGKEYQSIKYTDKLNKGYESLNKCSHGAFADIEKGIDFHYDVREALINKIEQIGENLEFVKQWTKNSFLWFLDYTEDKKSDYDYQAITKEKIKKCPQELQEIVSVYMR